MSSSPRSVAPLVLALTTSVAWAIGIATAAPVVAAPGDSSTDNSSPNGTSTSVLPVIGVIDGMWNQYVVPNAPVAPSQVGRFEQLIPTTTQVRDFFAFIQQFRGPASIYPPPG
jgi:hypothetical protein